VQHYAVISMKIAVLQKYNKAVESLADVTTINKLWYAEKHGYKFINDTSENNIDVTRSGTWLIELAILNTITNHPDVDWIFWTDVDSLITNPDIKLEDIIAKANPEHNIIANMWPLPSKFTFTHLTSENIKTHNVSSMWFMLHTGNWLIKNCQWSYDFLNMIYNDKRLILNKEIASHPTGDEVGLTIYYLAYPEYRKYIKIIPGSLFISIPETLNTLNTLKSYDGSDFILHVPFKPLEVKEQELNKHLARKI